MIGHGMRRIDMELEEMNEWLGAVEFLMSGDLGNYVENDFGDYVKVGDKLGGRYEKYDRAEEFHGVVNSAVDAVLWLYENNKADVEF